MQISGVILAGGRGLRMAGQDKGLVHFSGKPLIEHLVSVFAPQVTELIINANRNLDDYQHYGYPVVQDSQPDYAGPLAGILAGLTLAQHQAVVFTPCDTPGLSDDYVTRMWAAFEKSDTQACYAMENQNRHPTHVLLDQNLQPLLKEFLAQGQHKVMDWLHQVNALPVDFSDIPESFANINLPEDLV